MMGIVARVISKSGILIVRLRDPLVFLNLLWYVILVIVYFPKYLWLSFKHETLLAFDWGADHYGDFYRPIYEAIRARSGGPPILFFFGLKHSDNRFPLLRSGLPRFYKNLLDNKILIAADSARYKKLRNTPRVQIFHGLSSFGSVWQPSSFIAPFDVLFLPMPFMWEQLQNEYKDVARGKQVFKIGYPKLDYLIKSADQKVETTKTTLFYGPTYHRELSSIFDFLPGIVDVCRRNNYRLVIKLHPYLYDKHVREKSGGINWRSRIRDYQREYAPIVLLDKDTPMNQSADWFAKTDVFLTDVSGIGFEFVLATGRPIVFLGEKIKIPLEDLRAGRTERYADHAEILARGRIGPIVEAPSDLEGVILNTLSHNSYEQGIDRFRKEYTYNLGHATEQAVTTLLNLYEKAEKQRAVDD